MGGRGLIRLKYVHAFRDRTGRMQYYFRRQGKRTPLPGPPGSREFMGAYVAFIDSLSSRTLVSLSPFFQRPTSFPLAFIEKL
jgi:hypothetical protein